MIKICVVQRIFTALYDSTSIVSYDLRSFIAQLASAWNRYRKVTGSNPVEVLTFSDFYTQLLKLRS